MFKYLRFLCWVVVKEVLPALRKAMASRLGQKNQTGRKRKKETHIPSVDTDGEK